ncbi:hypothetical protein V8G54_030834 [Vigna mungo]|uniref:Uncharacterized protein n=1 Tax=Vigna mungo TaxID=3915 RepID=A0AAQ3RNB7_VIGMU
MNVKVELHAVQRSDACHHRVVHLVEFQRRREGSTIAFGLPAVVEWPHSRAFTIKNSSPSQHKAINVLKREPFWTYVLRWICVGFNSSCNFNGYRLWAATWPREHRLSSTISALWDQNLCSTSAVLACCSPCSPKCINVVCLAICHSTEFCDVKNFCIII